MSQLPIDLENKLILDSRRYNTNVNIFNHNNRG